MNPRAQRRHQSFIGWLVVLIGLGLAVTAGWFVVTWFFAADTEVARAAIAAGTSIVVAALTVTVTKVVDSRREVRAELRARYHDPYTKFVDMLFDMMGNARDGNQSAAQGRGARTTPKRPVLDQNIKAMDAFGRSIILQGSPEALRLWGAWRSRDWEAISDPAERSVRQMGGMLDLMVQMRRDFGHKISERDRADIGAIFLQRDAMAVLGLLAADSEASP